MGRGSVSVAAKAAILLFAGEAAAQNGGNCTTTSFSTNRESPFASQTMTVRAGVRCLVRMTGVQLRNTRVDPAPAHGQVEIDGANYTYVADPGYGGTDIFGVSWYNAVSGGRVGVTVNVRVVAQAAAPTTPQSGPSSVSATRASQGSPTPPAPPSSRSCRYLANGPITEQMRYGSGSMTVSRDWSCRVTMNGMTVTGVDSAPANGRVQVNGGTWTYVPNRNFTGSDRFTLNYNLAGVRIINTVDVAVVP